MNINQIDTSASKVTLLTEDLTKSLRHPGARTLKLIEKALKYLLPFESTKARTASPAERKDLLTLLTTHRTALSPYIDTDQVECHLKYY